MRYWARWLDFLHDPRMPQYVLYHRLKRRRRKPGEVDLPQNLTVSVALTFDVEYDFGSSGKEATQQAVEPFLKKIAQWGKEMGACFSLFIQGDLVGTCAGYLQELQKEHEIGLHGYSHELWGKLKWFLRQELASQERKQEFLERSLEQFSAHRLTRPTSFRAPDLVIDRDTLELLEAHGFTVDSSAPSYLGVLPRPALPLGPGSRMLEIPITTSPYSQVRFRYFLPFTFYEVFNMFQMATADDRHFIDYVDHVLNFQLQEGVNPHLVFLAHPWEFQEWFGRKGLGYCSEGNYELLHRKFSLLQEKYRINYVTLKGIGSSLAGKQNGHSD
jgi:peptidoglycan/xylan/chitin deacetylase (PgdA/CDA1 family)